VELIAASAEQFVRELPAAAPKPGHLIVAADRHNGAAFNGVMDGSLTIEPTRLFDGETDPSPSDESGLRLGTVLYSDRPCPITRIDAPLVGADYVRTYNTDKERKADVDCWYDVSLTGNRQEVFLMVLVDDRSKEKKQAVVDQIVSRFAKPGEFVDTGLDITIDDIVGPHSLSAFGKMAPTRDQAGNPIKYVFGSIPRTNLVYVIAATAEPPRADTTKAAEK
jgi:hypothetical protein